MEDLVKQCFGGIFAGKKVLLTGHTGFKGSWLTLWLQQLGANVTGVSLPPDTEPSHWALLNLAGEHYELDINNAAELAQVVEKIKPDLVLHLAAQALVRESYHSPVSNWQTNVMGTVNVLEACRNTPSVKAIIAVTTDKVYENNETGAAFTEQDALGGHDPYSASKAACELAIQSYRRSFFLTSGPLLASARAGNVIGGADWATDRLVPDLVRSCEAGQVMRIRSPQAIRPWQHVLDSLSGYLHLGAQLLQGHRHFATAWNFGPVATDSRTVADVLDMMRQFWPQLHWQVEKSAAEFHEAKVLRLNIDKAQQLLQWQPVWDVTKAATVTAQWYHAFYQRQQLITLTQLQQYVADARCSGVVWAN